jgi:hypothetical protein
VAVAPSTTVNWEDGLNVRVGIVVVWHGFVIVIVKVIESEPAGKLVVEEGPLADKVMSFFNTIV